MKKLFLCAALAASFGMMQPANAVTVTDANLTIPGMDPITLYLTSLDDAQITGNQIEFTLNVLGSYEDILEYEATVHFVGTK